MKNIVSILLIMFLALCCTACGDKYVSVMKYDNTIQIPQTAKFAVVKVDNKALFISEAKDLDIKTELKKAINEELTKQNLFGNDLIIKSTILDYRAGNAFKRWLMPGY